MRTRDLMTTPVITVGADATVKRAAELLVEHGVSALPVVDDDENLIGIVSEADLIGLETEPDPASHILPLPTRENAVPHTVREVMTNDVITIDELADVTLVAKLMVDYRLKSIPVAAGRHVVGVISRRDLLRMLVRNDPVLLREVTERLDAEVDVIGRVRADVVGGVVTLHGSGDGLGRRLAVLLARSVPGVIDVRVSEEAP